MKSHGKSAKADRKNELSTMLRHALSFFANRIDQGMNFEVSTSPEEPAPEQKEGAEGAEKAAPPNRTLIPAGSVLRFLERSKNLVLRIDYKPVDDVEDHTQGQKGTMRKTGKRSRRGKGGEKNEE